LCVVPGGIDRSLSPTTANENVLVTTQVSDSSPRVLDKSALYGGSRFFAAGLAACGCQARSKKLLRTTEGGEES